MTGIDLEQDYVLIRKMTLRSCGGTIRSNGWDPEEIISQVCQTLLLRNKGTAPYDARRGGNKNSYIWIVAQQVCLNLYKKKTDFLIEDMADATQPEELPSTYSSEEDSRVFQELLQELYPTERRYATYIIEDMKVSEIAEKEGIKHETARKIRQRTISHMKSILIGC